MSLHEVRMPQLNPNDTEVLLVEWLVPDGTTVVAGQPICVVETTKSAVEIEAPAAGYLRHRVKTGSRIPVQAVVGLVSSDATMARPVEDEAICSLTIFSKPARRRVAELGLTESDFQGYESVDVAAVEAVAARKMQGAPLPRLPQDEAGLVIYGTGNAALLALDCFQSTAGHRVVAFLDYAPRSAEHDGLPVLHRLRAKELRAAGVKRAFVAMPLPGETLEAMSFLETCGFELVNAVHDTAFVSSSATLGGNILIGARAHIGPLVEIGRGARILACASVAHHTRIGIGCIVADGTILGGSVSVGNEATLGLACAANAHVRIGARARIASGCCLYEDVPDAAVVRPLRALDVRAPV
jgi:acetyltransferase-like isoleucine patch superfamily enzyme